MSEQITESAVETPDTEVLVAGSDSTDDATQALAERDAVLGDLGKQAREEAKAMGRAFEKVEDAAKRIAILCLEARSAIVKTIVTDDGQSHVIHDWDGRTAPYEAWYQDYVVATLQEFAPVIEAGDETGKGEVRDETWITAAKRRIKYYVAEQRREYLSQNDEWLAEAMILVNGFGDKPRLDLTPPSEKAKQRRQEAASGGSQGSTDGDEAGNVPAPTRQVETLLKDNAGDSVALAEWLVLVCEQVARNLTAESLAGMAAGDRVKIAKHVTRANGVLDKIVSTLDEAGVKIK